jgi:hypothetical protein
MIPKDVKGTDRVPFWIYFKGNNYFTGRAIRKEKVLGDLLRELFPNGFEQVDGQWKP